MTLDVPGLRYRQRFSSADQDYNPGSMFTWNGQLRLITGRLYALSNGNWVPAPVFNQGPASLPKGTITVAIPYDSRYYELCVDDVFPHNRGDSGKFSEGGPFTKIHVDYRAMSDIQGVGTYDSFNQTFFSGLGYCQSRYVGGYVPASFQSPSWDGTTYSIADFNKTLKSNFLVSDIASSWGPTAWAQSSPKIQMADGLVFLSESRELPSMLMDQAKRFHKEWKFLSSKAGLGKSKAGLDPWRMQPKQVADEYLTQQFGWAPFMGDLNKFFKAYLNYDEYLKRMSRGNDRFIHVRRVLQDDIQITNKASGVYTWNLLPNNQWDQIGQIRPGQQPYYTYQEEKINLVTSSGMFKWYKPEFDMTHPGYDSLINNIYRHSVAYGVRVNPSNIWRATPWSWLVDWGLNVGRNIDALTAYVEDGVVCKYLFVMQHTIKRQVLNIVLPVMGRDVSLTYVNYTDVKLRRAADSPFGFGSPWSTLSPWRLSILAALGISRPSRVGFH